VFGNMSCDMAVKTDFPAALEREAKSLWVSQPNAGLDFCSKEDLPGESCI